MKSLKNLILILTIPSLMESLSITYSDYITHFKRETQGSMKIYAEYLPCRRFYLHSGKTEYFEETIRQVYDVNGNNLFNKGDLLYTQKGGYSTNIKEGQKCLDIFTDRFNH